MQNLDREPTSTQVYQMILKNKHKSKYKMCDRSFDKSILAIIQQYKHLFLTIVQRTRTKSEIMQNN